MSGDKLRGQTNTEFLIMFSFMLLLLAVSVFIYFLNLQEANQIKDTLEATQICLQVSSSISSFASLGGNSTYNFNLSDTLNGKNYTIRIASNASLVRIDYDVAGVGCRLRTTNLTNSSASTLFELRKNATIRNNGGALRVEP